MTIHKVFIVGGGAYLYSKMWEQRGFQVVQDINWADIIQFTGGSDVTPELYGEKQHPTTYNNPDRDDFEQIIYHGNVGVKPMVGICRGGQFLWVMNGGAMYQDVDGHATGHNHNIYKPTDSNGRELICRVTSTHHQMMKYPKDKEDFDPEILAVAYESKRKEYSDGDEQDLKYDIEVAFFKDTKCLCYQPHPEFGVMENADYYFRLIEELIVPRIYQG